MHDLCDGGKDVVGHSPAQFIEEAREAFRAGRVSGKFLCVDPSYFPGVVEGQ